MNGLLKIKTHVRMAMNQIGKIIKPNMSSLIYKGPDNVIKMIKVIKTFSLSTTMIALGVQPFLFQKVIESSSSFAIGFTGITSIGIVMSPAILNWFTRRYVTELHYDDNTKQYTAHVLNLFNRKSTVTFSADQVYVPEILGIFTTFVAGQNRRPLFVDPNFIVNFDQYKNMLGYNKPIKDIKLEQFFNSKNDKN